MAKVNLIEFTRETQREVAKVTWPTQRETVMTTILIVIMALVAGAFFLGVDSFMGFAISRILSMNT